METINRLIEKISEKLKEYQEKLNHINDHYSKEAKPSYTQDLQIAVVSGLRSLCKDLIKSIADIGRDLLVKQTKEQLLYNPTTENEKILFEMKRSNFAREIDKMSVKDMKKDYENALTLGLDERVTLYELEAPLVLQKFKNTSRDKITDVETVQFLSQINDNQEKRLSEETIELLLKLNDFKIYSVAAKEILSKIENDEFPLMELYGFTSMVGKRDLIPADVQQQANEVYVEFIKLANN